MKLLNPSQVHNYVLNQLTQKLNNKERGFSASLYSGITVKHFLEKLEQDEDDNIVIKVNKEKYDSHTHDYLIVKSYKIKQEMIRKEFKEKIIVHLSSADDVLRIAPETKEFKSTYGYVVKITINIKTV